jgi:hypothetical protein
MLGILECDLGVEEAERTDFTPNWTRRPFQLLFLAGRDSNRRRLSLHLAGVPLVSR